MVKLKIYLLIVFLTITNLFLIKADNMLTLGSKAPGFTLKDPDGKEYNLADYQGKNYVVLIFYPGDETPVCTAQLCEIRDDYTLFAQKNVVVFGINPQESDSHKKFSTKYQFQFPLLIDKDKKAVQAYKTKGLMMTTRTVYVIDKEGKIIFAQRGKPSVAEILQTIP